MTDLPEASDRFRRRYVLAGTSVLDEVEREVIGATFGANGYTTVAQADDLATRLELGPQDVLLDVGGGRGWPSLYMAEITGCAVVNSDPIFEGLQASRSLGDAVEHAAVQATGEHLPFRAASFDAVVHSDVLC